MELFVAKGNTSFGAHVLVHELGLPIPVTVVTLNQPGSAINRINPSGRVPALRLDNGSLLTENSAILPFLADLRPDTALFAPAGTSERAQIQSWIGYVNSEVHAGALRPINRPERYSADLAAHDSIRAGGAALLRKALAPIDAYLSDRRFLVGDRFTIADAYLGLFAGYLGRFGEHFADLGALRRYSSDYEQRPAVVAARQHEEQAVPT